MLFACPATENFFRQRIDHMIDLRHLLAVLASRMSWQQIEASVAHLFLRKARAGVAMPDLDLFGEQVQRAAVPQARLQRIRRRRGRADSPRWQFFSGCAYYEDRQPCDATTVVKFRQLLGEEGGEELLSQTINVAVDLQLNEQLEQAAILMQDSGAQLATVFVDLGYRGKSRRISGQQRKLLKRRQAIEPIIGHLKSDHRMDRGPLKGQQGDRLHALLCAAGYNIRWLLRQIAGLSPTWSLALRKRLDFALTRSASHLGLA